MKHSRVRAEDLVVNILEGEEWLADAYRLPLATVREVLTSYRQHQAQLAPVV